MVAVLNQPGHLAGLNVETLPNTHNLDRRRADRQCCLTTAAPRHSVTRLYAHLVFVTKYRRPAFSDAMLTDCGNALRDVRDAGAELVEFNGEPEHAQLLVSYPPTVAISDLVRRLKGAAPRPMRADYTGRCNRARMHGHSWTPSYLAVCAGGARLSIIKQYIKNQARPL
jgi:putative transposase